MPRSLSLSLSHDSYLKTTKTTTTKTAKQAREEPPLVGQGQARRAPPGRRSCAASASLDLGPRRRRPQGRPRRVRLVSRGRRLPVDSKRRQEDLGVRPEAGVAVGGRGGARKKRKHFLSLFSLPLSFHTLENSDPETKKPLKSPHIAALAGVLLTTWLEQCTAPYIDVIGEKSTTCTSPRNFGSRTICLAVPAWTEITFELPRLRTLQP